MVSIFDRLFRKASTRVINDDVEGGSHLGLLACLGDVCRGTVGLATLLQGDVKGGSVHTVGLIEGDVLGGRVRAINVIEGDVRGGEARAINLLHGDVKGGVAEHVNARMRELRAQGHLE